MKQAESSGGILMQEQLQSEIIASLFFWFYLHIYINHYCPMAMLLQIWCSITTGILLAIFSCMGITLYPTDAKTMQEVTFLLHSYFSEMQSSICVPLKKRW